MTDNITYLFKVDIFQDKDTGHWVIYSERFEISSYGKTVKEAQGMFEDIITDILLKSIIPPQPLETPFIFTSKEGFTTQNTQPEDNTNNPTI